MNLPNSIVDAFPSIRVLFEPSTNDCLIQENGTSYLGSSKCTIMSGSRSGIEGHAVMNYFAPRGQTHLGQPSVRRALEWRAMHMHNLHAPGED